MMMDESLLLIVNLSTDASRPEMGMMCIGYSSSIMTLLAIPCTVRVAESLTTEWPSSLSATH